MFNISDELYAEVYKSGKYKDPHQELANRLNLTRLQAKRAAYIKLYRNPLAKDKANG